MKKIIYTMTIVIAMFICINDVSAETFGRCVYEYNGVLINAEQISGEKAKININQDNALLNEDISSGATRSYTYKLDLNSKYFFNDGKFYCPKFNILITNNKFSNGNEAVKVVFSSKKPDCSGGFLEFGKNCDTYEVMDYVKDSSSYSNTCDFSVQTGQGIAKLTVENKGNGKINYTNDGGSYRAKIKLDDSIFFTDGIFNCDNVEVIAEICDNESNNGNEYRMFWKSSTDDKKYCKKTVLSEPTGEDVKTDKDKSNSNNQNNNNSNSNTNHITTTNETLKIVQQVYNIIKILVPVLIVALSIIDFLKVILISDDKNYKSAWDKFIKRLIIGVIFFLVPLIVSFILKYSGIETEQSYLEIFK